MTATETTGPVPAADPPVPPGDGFGRTVSIFTNLLPDEVVNGRRVRRVRRWVLSVLTVLLVAMGGWYGLSLLQTATAHTQLTRAEDDAVTLTRQQSDFADVVRTQAESKAISSHLAALMAQDLRWAVVLAATRAAAPPGVELTSISGGLATRGGVITAGSPAGSTGTGSSGTGSSGTGSSGASSGTGSSGAGSSGADNRLPTTGGHTVVGDLTIVGVAETKPQIAAYLDALARVDRLTDPYLDGVSTQEDGLQFTVRVDVNEAALGGRYATPAGDKAGDQAGDTAGESAGNAASDKAADKAPAKAESATGSTAGSTAGSATGATGGR
jgi:Tfp pilus assembly protein PilN